MKPFHINRFQSGIALAAIVSSFSFCALSRVIGQPPATKKPASELKPKPVSPPPSKKDDSVSFKKPQEGEKKRDAPKDKAHTVGFEFGDFEIIAKTGEYKGNDFIYYDEEENNLKVTGKQAKYKSDKKKKISLMDISGNLVLDDDKHHATGDKAHIDDSDGVKLATITGNVVIVLKPKVDLKPDSSDSAKQRGKGATITCDKVDDHYKKEFVVLTGHLTFKQFITKEDGSVLERTATAEHAEYDGKLNILHLFTPVDAVDTDKQEFHFSTDVFIGTKEGEETLSTKGPMKGRVLKDQEKNKDSGNPLPN